MKKIFNSLVILCAVLCAISASACTQQNGSITGGACSIKELNLEKNKAENSKMRFLPYNERNLRPVKIRIEMSKSTDDECLFGMCLYRQIMEGKGTNK